jgi:glycosyltransferase involved in cell wall biosynthesis
MKINFFFNHNQNINWSYYTILNAGLGGNYVALWNVARVMAKNGHDVTIFSYINREDVYDGVKMRHIKSLANDKSLGESDIFISCESGRAPNYFTAKKTINWIHRNTIDQNDTSFDETVVASQFHKDYLGLPNALIIPNGVDIEVFKPDPEKTREQGSMFFTGHPIKGMKELPKLFAKIKETTKAPSSMHTYGDAGIWGWDQSQFVQLQTEMIRNRIHYHGRMGQKLLAKFITQHQLFVYPTNFQEPFGLAVLEAMACGAVPIVSGVGNLPNLVGDAGYVIQGNPNDFGWITYATDKIKQLLEDPILVKRMSEKAITQAHKYTWDDVYEIWEKLVLN